MALLKAIPHPISGGPNLTYWHIGVIEYFKGTGKTRVRMFGYVDAATRAWKCPNADHYIELVIDGVASEADIYHFAKTQSSTLPQAGFDADGEPLPPRVIHGPFFDAEDA